MAKSWETYRKELGYTSPKKGDGRSWEDYRAELGYGEAPTARAQGEQNLQRLYNNTYVNWEKSASDLMTRINKDVKAREGRYQQRADIGKYQANTDKEIQTLLSQAGTMSNYYTKNKAQIDKQYGAGTADNILKRLTDSSSQFKSVQKELAGELEYWNQFDSEDAYKKATANQKEQERLKNLNLEKTKADIAKLDKQLGSGAIDFIMGAFKDSELYLKRQDLKKQRDALSKDYKNATTLRTYNDYMSGLDSADTAAASRPSIKRKDTPYDLGEFMTPDEVKVYNNLQAQDFNNGSNKAKEFENFMLETLKGRAGERFAENILNVPVLPYAYGLYAGVDQWNSGVQSALASVFAPKAEAMPASFTQQTSQHVRDGVSKGNAKLPDWLGGGSVGQMAYDLSTATGNMAPSILLSSLTSGAGAPAAVAGAVGAGSMGISAGGNAYNEALKLGYSNSTARNYGALIGASEAGLSYLLGGIGGLSGKVVGKSLQTAIGNIDNAVLRVASNIGVNMAKEGSEEYLQSILEPAFRNLVLGENNEIKLFSEDAAYSFLMGAITAGILEGPSSVSGGIADISTAKAGRAVVEAKQYENLLGNALNLPASTEAFKLAQNIQKGKSKATWNNVGQLIEAYKDNGGDLSFMQTIPETPAQRVMPESATAQQSVESPAAKDAAIPSAEQKAALQLREGRHTASIQTGNGESIQASVVGIDEVRNGKAEVLLSDGTVASLDDVTFDDAQTEMLFDAAKSFDTEAAKTFVESYDGSLPVKSYYSGFTRIYNAARDGKSLEQAVSNSLFAYNLPPQLQQAAYYAGQNGGPVQARENTVEAEVNTATKADSEGQSTLANDTTETKGGIVRQDSGKKLSRSQDTQIKALDAIGKKYGVGIVIEDSIDVQDGDRVRKSAANGRFDPSTGRIHIALNATNEAYLYVGMHELVHYVKEYNADGYSLLEDVVLDALRTNGQDVDALIQHQKDLLPEATRARLSETELNAYAREEVIANSVPSILTDDEIVRRLVETDRTLAQKIADFFNEFISELKRIAKQLSGEKSWAQIAALSNDIDSLQEIADMFMGALEGTERTESSTESAKYSLNPRFQRQYDRWDKINPAIKFEVGRTSEELQSIGVKEQRIIWDSSKIIKIKAKHPAMTDTVIKQVPNIIEAPVLVLQSQQEETRIVLFGEVFDANDAPVLAVLELEPIGQGNLALNVIKIASAYGKDSNPQRLINTSDILYIDPNKNRTDKWLTSTRLQLPVGVNQYGSISRISYSDNTVNTSIRERGENDSRFSLKDTEPIDVDQLIAENAKLSEALEAVKEQFKLTEGHKISDKAIDSLAEKVIRDYKSSYDADTLTENLRTLFDYLANAEEVAWDEVSQMGIGMARAVVEASPESSVKDEYGYDTTGEAYDLFLRLYDEYFNLPEVKTYADKQAAKFQQLRSQYRQHITEVRQAAKARYDTRLKALRAENTAMRQEISRKYNEAKEKQHKEDMAQYREKFRALTDRNNEKLLEQKARFIELKQEDRVKMTSREASSKYKRRIEKNAKTLYKWLLHPTDAKHVPEFLRHSVADFLDTIDFAGEKETKVAEKWRERLRDLKDAMARIDRGDTEGVDFYMESDPDFVPRLEEFIGGSRDFKTISDMSETQLKEIDFLIGMLKRSVTDANKLMANTRYEEVQEVAEASTIDMDKRPDKKALGPVMTFLDNLVNIEQMDSFSYFDELGPAARSVFDGIRAGLDKKIQNIATSVSFMKGTLKGVDVKKISGTNADVKTFNVQGGELKLTVAQIMELYVLNKREQARGHIYGGGIKPLDSTIRAKGKTIRLKKYNPVKVSEVDVTEIINTLSAEQKRVAEEMQQFLEDTVADWGNETSLTLYGYKKFTERNYWPIKSDENYTNTQDPDKNNGFYALKNLGMTKSTTKNANNPMLLGDIFDTFTRHVDDMASYNAFVVPLSDAMKWFNYKTDTGSVKQSIERVSGAAGKKYFTNFIKAVNGSSESSHSTEAGALLIRNTKIASVGANLRVVAQQPTAYLRATALIDPKYLAAAVFKRSGLKKALKYAPIVQWKAWGFYDLNIGRSLRNIITGQATAIERVGEGSLWLAQQADNVTWGALWNACELEIAEKSPELKRGSEDFNIAVGDRLSELVDRTQVVDTVLHRSQMARSKDTLVKMASAFMSEPNKSYNMLRNAILRAAREKTPSARKNMYRVVTTFVVTSVATAAMAGLIDSLRDDDRDKEGKRLSWHERYKKAFGSNVLDTVNPLNLIPYVKDIISMISGYTPTRMDLAGMYGMVTSVNAWRKYFAGGSDKSVYKLTSDSVKAISKVFGIPAGSLLREFETLYSSVAKEGIDWKNDRATRERTYIAMYEAILDGDTQTYKNLEKYLKEQSLDAEQIDNGLKMALVDNDPRITEAATARKSGDMETYKAIFEELKAEGFSHNAVIKAVNYVMVKMGAKTGTEEETYNPDSADLYAYSDLYTEIDGGDVKGAAYLIEQFRAAGKAPETIRAQLTKEFKPVYLEYLADKDTKSAQELAKLLISLDVGYEQRDIDQWPQQEERKKQKELEEQKERGK